MKRENDSKDDMISKLNQYIRDTCTHFYTDQVDGKVTDFFVLHANQLYIYSPKNNQKSLVALPNFGGNESVRLLDGEKSILVSGQDEVIYRNSQLNESC